MLNSIEVWLSRLTDKNFWAVYNVASEVRQQVQLSDKAIIDLRAKLVTPEDQLLTAEEVEDVRNELQWRAVEALCSKKIFSNVIVIEGSPLWPTRLCVWADIPLFNTFAELIDKEYERRSHFGEIRKPERHLTWILGSFYLVASVVILASLVTASLTVPPWSLLIVAVCAILLVVIIGTILLRYEGALKDKSFVKLIVKALGILPPLKK
ncbi:MAG TPA: hypothetical protein VJ302_29035 [Blastocatellia bacterium]|nr:hypothetical protein [Blastocatellia bacterium]